MPSSTPGFDREERPLSERIAAHPLLQESEQDPMKPVTPRALFLAMLLGACRAAEAADPVATQQGATQVGQAQSERAGESSAQLTAQDQVLARIWGLSSTEMQRASLLLKGPRAAFSAPNLTPIEALGIHARSAGERRKYAEMFAKAHQQDVERVLEWSREFDAALRRLYPDLRVVDWANAPKVPGTPGMAEAARVPQGAYIPVEPDLATLRKPRKN